MKYIIQRLINRIWVLITFLEKKTQKSLEDSSLEEQKGGKKVQKALKNVSVMFEEKCFDYEGNFFIGFFKLIFYIIFNFLLISHSGGFVWWNLFIFYLSPLTTLLDEMLYCFLIRFFSQASPQTFKFNFSKNVLIKSRSTKVSYKFPRGNVRCFEIDWTDDNVLIHASFNSLTCVSRNSNATKVFSSY